MRTAGGTPARRRPAVTVEPVAMADLTRLVTVRLAFETTGTGFVDVSDAVASVVRDSGIRSGLAILFCRHTSASLIVGENADPDVLVDLAAALDRLAPRDRPYLHADEGPDDMPAHIRAMLTGASLAVPVVSGRPALGRWQGLYLVEHRDDPHRREILVTLVGG